MRLRSNHVLPDPNQVPPPPRRRRQTRASSAQPTEPATATARGPAKKVTKKTRGKKNARKAKTPSPEPEILSSTTSPAPRLVVSQDHSPLAATPAVQPTDDRELDSSIRPQDPQYAPQDTPVTPQDFPEMPETLLGASLFTIEEEEEPFSPFQQLVQQRNEERIQARILEQERIQQRVLVRIAEERRRQERIHQSQTSPIPLDEPQHPSLSSLEDDDEFVDACEVIDRNSKSAKRWLLRKKLFGGGPLPVLEVLSPFSEDRKYRIMNNMDLPDPPGIWTKIKETQGLTYYQDRWGIKRVYQPDQPESSPAKRQKSSTASPAILSSPRPRGASRKTYADRTRRRQIEANGRIDRTLFRLPELLAQQRADAAANTARLSPNSDDTIPPMTPPPTAPAPAAAATQPNTSWRRWMFDSVTRRWTSLWGGTPAEEAAEQPIVEEPQTPHAQNISSDPPASAPSAYYAARSRQENPDTVIPQHTGNPRVRRRTQARPYYPSRRYDLYPRGFDEALLDRCFAGSTAPGDRKVPAPPEQTQSHEKEKEKDSSNKRKRQPSPDVIPNPPGCSYGLHDDYFTYDDDDEAWAAEEQARRDAAKTSPGSKEPATKKARANFNHAGHFEVPDSSGSEGPTPVKQPAVKNFNRSGHFEVPESSGSEGPTPVKQPAVKNFNRSGHFEVPESSGSEEASSPDTGKSSGPNAQGARSKRSPSPLTKARRTAEQHKPKTPSRLRAAHRFSLDPAIMDNLDKMMESEDPAERARAATVLQACPTGDLRSVKWPKTKSWVDKIDMVWDDINTRDRYWRNRMAAGGMDRDKEMQYRVHKQFQEGVAVLAKARRDGRCALV